MTTGAMALWLWFSSLAVGHPFGAKFAAHRLELHVELDHVEVHYVVDVPNPIVGEAGRGGQDPIASTARDLISGLALELDGDSVLLTLDPDRTPSASPTDDTHQFDIWLIAPVTASATEIRLSNGNLPDVMSVYSSRVTLGPALAATDCSLWRQRDGALVRDDSDRWRTEVSHRTLEVAVTRPRGPTAWIWRAVRDPSEPPRMAAATTLPDRSEVASIVGPLAGLGLVLVGLLLWWRRR